MKSAQRARRAAEEMSWGVGLRRWRRWRGGAAPGTARSTSASAAVSPPPPSSSPPSSSASASSASSASSSSSETNPSASVSPSEMFSATLAPKSCASCETIPILRARNAGSNELTGRPSTQTLPDCGS